MKKKVWLITGASSGLGLAISKSALAAGNKVVATGRDKDKVSEAIGEASDNLLVVTIDVTNPKEIEAAVKSAVDKFGTIDVLVNNAGNFYAGFFEELSPRQIELQLATSLFGPMNVTRAVLPVMRKIVRGISFPFHQLQDLCHCKSFFKAHFNHLLHTVKRFIYNNNAHFCRSVLFAEIQIPIRTRQFRVFIFVCKSIHHFEIGFWANGSIFLD
jgi:NAD(P)-dependent dehydrogenase (short-subunit alcohol dehydrogenase family)